MQLEPFNGKFYNQIEAVAMGFSLTSVLDNIFMVFYGARWLNEYSPNKVINFIQDTLMTFQLLLTRNKIH